MNAAVAQAPVPRMSVHERPSARLSRDKYKVMKSVDYFPCMTINALQDRLPDVKNVPAIVESLTERSFILRYHTVYVLTFIGRVALDASHWMMK